jgi:hypothetical protein
MFLRTLLFGLVFALIAPQSRSFLSSLVASAGEEIHAQAPLSYALIVIVSLAWIASMLLLQNWTRRKSKNPIVSYRKQVHFRD